MAKLMISLKLGSTQDPIISVSHPSDHIRTIFGEAFNTGLTQKFIWYPGYVLFFPPGRSGSYWVEVYTSDRLEIQPETIRAIAVPFTVSSFNQVSVASKDELSPTLSINEGNYQLLFEARYLTVDEARQLAGFDWYNAESDKNLQKFAPEQIRLTFIPVVELLEPKILRAESGFNPPQNLSINSSYKESSYQTDVPLVSSPNVTPALLEFVGIAEQSLRAFYQTDRIYFRIRRESAFGDPDRPLWIEVYNIPPKLDSWEASLSIGIELDGRITLGGIVWGGYGMRKIWQLEHTTEGEFSWSDLYNAGLIRQDAETLQQLLIILEEKAKVHFQSIL